MTNKEASDSLVAQNFAKKEGESSYDHVARLNPDHESRLVPRQAADKPAASSQPAAANAAADDAANDPNRIISSADRDEILKPFENAYDQHVKDMAGDVDQLRSKLDKTPDAENVSPPSQTAGLQPEPTYRLGDVQQELAQKTQLLNEDIADAQKGGYLRGPSGGGAAPPQAATAADDASDAPNPFSYHTMFPKEKTGGAKPAGAKPAPDPEPAGPAEPAVQAAQERTLYSAPAQAGRGTVLSGTGGDEFGEGAAQAGGRTLYRTIISKPSNTTNIAASGADDAAAGGAKSTVEASGEDLAEQVAKGTVKQVAKSAVEEGGGEEAIGSMFGPVGMAVAGAAVLAGGLINELRHINVRHDPSQLTNAAVSNVATQFGA